MDQGLSVVPCEGCTDECCLSLSLEVHPTTADASSARRGSTFLLEVRATQVDSPAKPGGAGGKTQNHTMKSPENPGRFVHSPMCVFVGMHVPNPVSKLIPEGRPAIVQTALLDALSIEFSI